MAHVVEVDQSGKIEDTATDTVVAFADGKSYAILIPAAVKRTCLRELRRRGRTGKSIYRLLFATALFLLLRDHIGELVHVTVDVEYEGHSGGIKGHLLNLLHRAGIRVAPHQVSFRRISKKSPAHDKAYNVFRGDEIADRTVTAAELLAEF